MKRCEFTTFYHHYLPLTLRLCINSVNISESLIRVNPQTLQLNSRIHSIEVGKSSVNKLSFSWPSNWSVIWFRLQSSGLLFLSCVQWALHRGVGEEGMREWVYACEKPLSTLLLFHLKCTNADWHSERMMPSETGVGDVKGEDVKRPLWYPGWVPI